METLNVLIAEDDLISQKIILKHLETLELRPIMAQDGKQAYDMYNKDNSIHFLIINWMMPSLSGPNLCQKIRRHPQQNRLRPYIILLTSKTHKEAIIYGINAGADDFISKPIDKQLFLVRMNAAKRIIASAQQNQAYSDKIQLELDKQLDNLKHAQLLQKNLNTVKIPHLKHTTIKSFFMPSEGLSGDFFDIQKHQNKLIIFIADYSGHGVKVAINAAISKSIVDRRLGFLHQGKLEEFFYHLNNDLFKYISSNGEFCTAFAAIIDLKEDLMHYCNASHPLPILVRQKKIIPYENTENFFLGYERKTEFVKKQISLEAHDRLFFYSDAIYEVIQNGKVVFNEKDLQKTILRSAAKNVNDSFENLLHTLEKKNKSFPLEDDCTLIIVQKMPPYKRTVNYRKIDDMEKGVRLLRKELYKHEFSADDIEKIVICFNEIFINAIKHGNKNNPQKKVIISYNIDLNRCTLSFTDEGDGHPQIKVNHPTTKAVLKALDDTTFHPSLYHGRGIWLVKRFSSAMKFNSKGNQVTLTFEQKKNHTEFYY